MPFQTPFLWANWYLSDKISWYKFNGNSTGIMFLRLMFCFEINKKVRNIRISYPCCLFVVSFGEAMSTYWLINNCQLSLNLVTIYKTEKIAFCVLVFTPR